MRDEDDAPSSNEVIPLQRTPQDLAAAIEQALAPLERQARDLEVTVALKTDGIPRAVDVDGDKLVWCVLALTGAALRYAKRGTRIMPGGSIEVRLTYDHGANELTITVTDDGPGMPPSFATSLLEPSPKGALADGSAIRLVAAIVRAHRGAISIQSNQDVDDHGTTVTLVVPAASRAG